MLTNFHSSPWKSTKKNHVLNDAPPDSPFRAPKQRPFPYDRYIPSKVSSEVFDFHLMKVKSNSNSKLTAPKEEIQNTESETLSNDGNGNSNTNEILREDQNMVNYATILEKNIIGFEEKQNDKNNHLSDSCILKYKKTYHESKKTTQILGYDNFSPGFHSYFNFSPQENLPLQSIRKISSHAYKILDAPNLQDDFYLNVLDWSHQNLIGVGLENTLYTWSPTTNHTSKIIELDNEALISAVNFNHSNMLSMGENNGTVRIFDVETCKQLYQVKNHTGRVATIAWNGNLIATGSRDKNINIMDSRFIHNNSKKSLLFSLSGHSQEVCGTKWSFDYEFLASGGNDNKVFLWSLKMPKKNVGLFTEHKAAVKALAWSPHQFGLLSSGGGTNDKTIKFWNTRTMTCVKSLDVGSQVCNMAFSKNVNELVSTHGFLLNQIFVWRYPELKKIATLSGHRQRILYLAMSPDGEDVVTGAGDDTIRFWKVFPKKEKNYLENRDNQMDFNFELR